MSHGRSRGVCMLSLSLTALGVLPQDKAEFLHRVGRVGRHGNRGVAVALVWDAHSDSVRLQEEAVISNVYTVAKALADRRTGGTGQVDPVKANFQIAPADEEELVKLLQDAISTDGGEAKYADPVVYYPGMDASFSPAFEWSDPRLGMYVSPACAPGAHAMC